MMCNNSPVKHEQKNTEFKTDLGIRKLQHDKKDDSIESDEDDLRIRG